MSHCSKPVPVSHVLHLAQEGEAEVKLYPLILVAGSVVGALPGQDLGADGQAQA